MSVRVMAKVWELALPQNEKLILLAFADHADDDGLAYPSIRRIAWKSGYSERQARTIVGRLKKRGILDATDAGGGGRGLTTAYRILPEKGARIAPFSPQNPAVARRETLKPRAEKGAIPGKKRARILKEPSGTINQPSLPSKNGGPGASRNKSRAEQRTFDNLAAAGFSIR